MNKINFKSAVYFLLPCLLVFSSCSKQENTVEQADEANFFSNQLNDGDAIPGHYIVFFNEGFESNNLEKATKNKASYEERKSIMMEASGKVLKTNEIPQANLKHVYSKAAKGMAVRLNDKQLQALKADENVASVVEDVVIILAKPEKPGGGNGGGKGGKGGGGGDGTTSTQTTPWGITRVGGADATSIDRKVWVIDSGVDLDHADLNVITSLSKSFVSGNSSADDQNGHGTHVAGTIGAKNNTIGVTGVAAGAKIVSVRVLDQNGSGTLSGVIAGIDYVAANATAGEVANLSLGGSANSTLDDAVSKAAAEGIFFAIAAGNNYNNAIYYSPARVNGDNVFTVSAMDKNDNFATFSNYGTPVDFCAPGVSISSTYLNGSYATLSGTSMAAPHVAGLLLLKGNNIGTDGFVKNDPDNSADPIAHY